LIGKYEKSIESWWKKSVVLNALSWKNTALPVIQFSQYDISIHAALALYVCGLLYAATVKSQQQ
jgi:hypothetical protein